MLILEIVVVLLCGVCKLIGELWWHNAQRYIMPVMLGVTASIVSHVWWLGFCMLPMIGPLVVGYSVYGKSDGFDRGMWLFSICFVAGLGLVISQHVVWYFYIPYCILAGIWGGVSRRWWNVVIAPISGMLIGSIILFVR